MVIFSHLHINIVWKSSTDTLLMGRESQPLAVHFSRSLTYESIGDVGRARHDIRQDKISDKSAEVKRRNENGKLSTACFFILYFEEISNEGVFGSHNTHRSCVLVGLSTLSPELIEMLFFVLLHPTTLHRAKLHIRQSPIYVCLLHTTGMSQKRFSARLETCVDTSKKAFGMAFSSHFFLPSHHVAPLDLTRAILSLSPAILLGCLVIYVFDIY